MSESHERVRIFVETEAGTDLRRRYDETTLVLESEHRVAARYPYAYGFVLDTQADDGGAVDCFLLTDEQVHSGTIVDAEILGLVEQFEHDEVDHKILAATSGAAQALDMNDVHERLRAFIAALFRPYPGARVEIGRMWGAHDAKNFIASHRAAGTAKR